MLRLVMVYVTAFRYFVLFVVGEAVMGIKSGFG